VEEPLRRKLEISSPMVSPSRRVLIACIGNIFLGDDGFGVEVARRLQNRTTKQYPAGVEVVDFGIRGMDLAYALLDDYDMLVLVDAVPRGGSPGTLYLIEPTLTSRVGVGIPASQAECPVWGTGNAPALQVALDSHSMDPVKVLAFARTIGARPIRTLLVGCEPTPIGGGEDYAEMQMGLSGPVQAAVDKAIKMIDALVEELGVQQGS
jgi:hydrogenase maturation protease